MIARLAKFVSRRWPIVILAWLGIVVGLRVAAPRWDDITYDGNLAYLPATMPSVIGEQLLDDAFPHDRAKSQIVLVVAREHSRFTEADANVAYDLARRFQNHLGAALLDRAKELRQEVSELRDNGKNLHALNAEQRADQTLMAATLALDEAVELDETLFAYHKSRLESSKSQPSGDFVPERLVAAFLHRSVLRTYVGDAEKAHDDLKIVEELRPALLHASQSSDQSNSSAWPLVDVWTWRDELIGKKLGYGDHYARLIVLQLSNEFLETDNVRVLEMVEAEIAEVRNSAKQLGINGLTIAYSGSAAIGGDMRRSAAESIKNTELFAVLLIIVILVAVYRSPLLVLVPLISIGVAFVTSINLVALLAQWADSPDTIMWSLKVFTTTKIFIVVILFGAGTDFCLFLIARFKEELIESPDVKSATEVAVRKTGAALAASALTTVVGLGMMYFADFGKYHYTGPVIGLCLLVTLLTCLTLSPALLAALGKSHLWFNRQRFGFSKRDSQNQLSASGTTRFWEWLARNVVTYPGRLLVSALLLLLPFAAYGFYRADYVTYDFSSNLSEQCVSRQGKKLMTSHFPIGETGPVTVLVRKKQAEFQSKSGRDEIQDLAHAFYVPGVVAVRNIKDPLGNYPPGKKRGLFNPTAWFLANDPRTAQIFVAQSPPLTGEVARLDVVLEYDPFSIEAAQVLDSIDARFRKLREAPDSYWHDATIAYAGTTAGIRDLREVTRSDNVRIQVLVVVAVFVVLLIMLRRPLVCAYMMCSVLFSFYVTLGVTLLFFEWLYAGSFYGLDWKVPLFLFVILVAVGQDYNIYLATRVFEEQEQFGPMQGLRRSIVHTGGIISSCGLIMAGTFIAMTITSWGPYLTEWLPISIPGLSFTGRSLRDIAELGFALSVGVLLDTFVVRTLLMPSFFAIESRVRATRGYGQLAPSVQKASGT